MTSKVNDLAEIRKKCINMTRELLWQFQIVSFKGGKTIIATNDTRGIIKLKTYWAKGFVGEISENNGTYTAEVVDDKFLTLTFRNRS